MQKDEIEIWDIKKIIPYVRNPVKHPEGDVTKMAGLLKEFGCRPPLLIKSDGELVDGHLRYLAALKLSWNEVSVILCDDWSDAKIKAYRITSRNSAKWAEWDDELLTLEMDDLKGMDFDTDLLGFNTNIDNDSSIPEFLEYDENVSNDVEYIKCPHCGKSFPK